MVFDGTPPAEGIFGRASAVAHDLAAVDWAATPLGVPSEWPQSLRTAVDILLSSRFSMWMAWGKDLTFFCNESYRRGTLGRKYPWALGRPAREVWAEVWDEAGPRIERVLATGTATWDEGLQLFLERYGYTEETYHTFSYSPLRDDTGTTAGMLCVVSEETERVVSERRMATLRDLGSDPAVIRTEQEVLTFTGEQFEHNPFDLPFTITYLLDTGTGELRRAAASGICPSHGAAPPTLQPDDATGPWPTGPSLRGPVVVDLDADRFADLPSGAWPVPPRQAAVVPIRPRGRDPFGVLVAGLNPFRPWDADYRGFITLVAGHLAAGLVAATGYEDQARRAARLAELDRTKSSFFANVSHEFRTPLTLIMGPAEDQLARLPRGDPARRPWEMVRRNGLRLGRLVTAVLDFSRLESGKMPADLRAVDLVETTAELVAMFDSAAARLGLTLDVERGDLPAAVRVDPTLWEKIVFNLISNALKFTFEGSIRVRIVDDGDRAAVSVSDTGVGVPPAEMPRLFERFHRIDASRARSFEGSGIGLAMVKELVELHDGDITATSAVDVGTTFTVRLPYARGVAAETRGVQEPGIEGRADAAEPFVQEALEWSLPDTGADAFGHADSAPTDGRSGGQPRAPHVLVGDDNADMRAYLTHVLGGAGYRVTGVADGDAVLAYARSEQPDLIVSDVMMPGIDGLLLVRALRSDPITSATPIILLSARAGQDATVDGFHAGADDYLVKPFAAVDLLTRARSVIQLARLRSGHARWRAALVDALQEAFFVCDEHAAVIEINAAFTEILGYGPEELPYEPIYPWWPDPVSDPGAHRMMTVAFARLVSGAQGRCTIPINHRDGHRVWVSASANAAEDPETGRRVTVGTFRDITDEHDAVRRESAIAGLVTRLAQATDLDDTVAKAAHELRELWHAHRAVAVLFGTGPEPAVIAGDPATEWQALPERMRNEITHVAARPPLSTLASEEGAGVLVEHPEGPLVVWLDTRLRRRFSAGDRLLLTLLASHLTQALQRARQSDVQRETAIALQRAILAPAQLPGGFVARYEPATPPLEVGGDWYDVVTLPGDRAGIVVGDCVGRGLPAAAVMGQLRSACRALLLRDSSPSRVLMELDRFATGVDGAACSTVFCAILDPSTGDLTYSSAGHPPAIVVGPDGRRHLLDEGRSVPLAVRADTVRTDARFTIPPRGTFLLYTDGLVERRKRSILDGIDHAAAVVREARDRAVGDVADDVMQSLAPDEGYEDDVALLVYRHPAALEVTFPADADQLAPTRQALRRWLRQCDVSADAAQDVLTAAGEACTNAIEHGYRDRPGGPIRLRAEARRDTLHLVISDGGRWKTPRPQEDLHRGRGIAMMRAMMSAVDIVHDADGTTVDMHRRIA